MLASIDASLGFSLVILLGGALFSTDGDGLSTATGDVEGDALDFTTGCADGVFVSAAGLGFEVALDWTGKAVGEFELPSTGAGTLILIGVVGPTVLFDAVSVIFSILCSGIGCIVGT